jgi:hypothetical protein
VYYFERKFKGKFYRAAAPDLPDDEFVLHSVIRSLCATAARVSALSSTLRGMRLCYSLSLARAISKRSEDSCLTKPISAISGSPSR